MKTILGLDLGTNSIGWALIEIDHQKGIVKIIGLGSRILPMNAGEIGDFERGTKIKSTTAQRTEYRGTRRLNERFLLRRDRLHLVLDLLDALPEHYKLEIDFTNSKVKKCGQFKKNKEPKIAYLPKQKGKKAEFLFMDSYLEMLDDINCDKVKNTKHKRIPYDWTLYYLRQKALSKKITLEELAWVLLSYNQKRGYEKTEVEDKSTKTNEIIEELDLKVKDVIPKKDNNNRQYYEIHLEGNDNFIYKEYSDIPLTSKDDIKEVIKISKVDDEGNIDNKKNEFKITDIYPLEIKDVKHEKLNGKHIYTLTFQNGWIEEKLPIKKFTFRYKNVINKPYDYIVETVYDYQGNIKTKQGKERTLREPNFDDTSSDWTLLKKKTEKEALVFNLRQGYTNNNGDVKKYISPKIYSVLKNDAIKGTHTKIIGGMFQVVDREFYREELNQIINTQRKFHTCLEDKKLFERCVKTLYPNNENHQKSLLENKNAIQHLLVEDILLYQRPLKIKKSEISDCKHEIRYWKRIENKDGKVTKEPVYLKAVSKSHPYFQEFRIWDKLHNLRLIQLEKEINGEKFTNQDITKEYFKREDDYLELFDKLNNSKSLNQDQFLSYCKKKFKINYDKKASNYVWNFPEDEEIKGNETRVSFATRFIRCGFKDYKDFLTQEKELRLWHYLYSVNYKVRTDNNNKSIRTFFNNFFEGYNIDDSTKEKIILDFANYPKFESMYCAYSEKALKKLLPLIRLAKRDKEDTWITEKWYKKWLVELNNRKNTILTKLKDIDFSDDEVDYSNVVNVEVNVQKGEIPFPKGLFSAFKGFEKVEDFAKLNLTQASYLVYGRHSELAIAKYWKSPDEIREQLHKELKQHSLNNPVAEKVILEMMQVVTDIWEIYGKSKENFFSEIHLEVGRELKKSAKQKQNDSTQMSANRAQNKRLRQILEEFLNNSTYNAIPNNYDHFERLKIVEEGAETRKNYDKSFFDNKPYSKKDIDEILKKTHITKQDFEKYKLWIEQGYLSPYSGQIIKLTDLFNGAKYNIDHIFPQASITNNSLNNKVVVEVELNQLKGDRTAREFIQAQNGQPHPETGTKICSEEEYLSIVNAQFTGNKKHILLSKDIPKEFTNSQMNNMRYIARKAMELLSHIVREQGEVEFRSKNVLPVTGAITNELKRAWRLNKVWTELVSPRFIRLNKLTQSNLFGEWQISKNGNRYFDCNLDTTIRDKNESYDIKRIDHRHHALDALIIALCTEDHVNYINNINADAKYDEYGKQKQIEDYRLELKRKIKFTKKDNEKDDNNWYYMLPGEARKKDAKNSKRDSIIEMCYMYKDMAPFGQDYKKMILTALQDTIVTFKQNLRVINKTVNYYQKWVKQYDDSMKKVLVKQTKGDHWAIRRSLGEKTFYKKIDIKDRENKQLHKNAEFFYHHTEAIVDEELRDKIQKLKEETKSEDIFKIKLKETFDNILVECIAYKIASRAKNEIGEKFTSKKIKTISDREGQTINILLNHLKQFDTVTVSFEEGIRYFDSILEKEELITIANDENNNFQSIDELIKYLRENDFKYKKSNYSELNVFIDKISDRDFRNDARYIDKIKEHPEIAFSPTYIEKMNDKDELKRLNGGKPHKPIKKVSTFQKFGTQRPVSKNKHSVKSRQYVVNDGGTNIYLAIYEIEDKSKISKKSPIRLFREINIFDIIEFQKATNSNNLPVEKFIFSNEGERYNFLFTLTQNDVVKVKNGSTDKIFAFNRFSQGDVYFRPINHAFEIYKCEVDLKINNKTGKLIGSQENETTSFNGEQIKNTCWKLEVNRLGQIKKQSYDQKNSLLR
ncbi:MAG: hypothetical protein GX361_05610 [Bacteroidales bacterium]|nr:hypothetical protein [Bacteroidales bacterium]